MVGGGAGVTAEQLPSILTHTAVLNVVVIFLLRPVIPPVVIVFPFSLRQIVPGLPLDPLLLLPAVLHIARCVREQEERSRQAGMVCGTESKENGEGAGGNFHGSQGEAGGLCNACVCMWIRVKKGRDKERKW